MDLHLKGKVVAVTGGAAGIGRAAAEEFLKEGALLAVCGRTEARLEAFAAEMKEQGFPEVYTMQADVSSAEQMNAFAAGNAFTNGPSKVSSFTTFIFAPEPISVPSIRTTRIRACCIF